MENKFQQSQIHADLSPIINFIADSVRPEKIFCISHQTDPQGVNNLHILVIIPEDIKRTFPNLEKLLQSHPTPNYRINYTLFKGYHFDTMIKEGHLFYTIASTPENQIYDSGTYALPEINQTILLQKRHTAITDFTTQIHQAQTTYNAAESQKTTNPTLAAFLLHQTVELTFRAIMNSLTGYANTSHKIDEILKHSNRLTNKLSQILYNEEQQDQHLLQLLDAAYISCRRNEPFTITQTDLSTLFHKIKTLILQTRQTFTDTLSTYDSLHITTTEHA